MTKLTPWDAELCVMIRSLTGQDPEIAERDDCYKVIVDCSGKTVGEKKAIDDAICGRLFGRLKCANYTHLDKAGIAEYFIMYSDEYEKLPVELRSNVRPANPLRGNKYCLRIKEISAVQARRDNVDDVIAFCGNASVQIPRRPGGVATFSFIDANGMIRQVMEGDYIALNDRGSFDIILKDDFERDYEPKR